MSDDERKAQYKKAYGRARQLPDYEKCAEEVSSPDSWQWYQCRRKAGHGPHGAWCKQHDPVARKAKDEARWGKLKAETDRSIRDQQFTAACRKAISDIAAGHNDPAGLAREIMEKWGPKE